jgi:hypothetical protein
MSLHQKRVTITAVDLSKVSENCVVVLNYEEGDKPTCTEFVLIRDMILKQRPDFGLNRIIMLRKGQTLTVEQLPKQPAPEAQKET